MVKGTLSGLRCGGLFERFYANKRDAALRHRTRLGTFVKAPAVSGYEQKLAEKIRERLKGYALLTTETFM